MHEVTAIAGLRTRYGVPAGALPILHVGSGAPYKNVEGVLHALAYVRACAGTACLLKVGWLTPAQWALARRLDLEPAIRELGEVPEEDLPGVYALAHCLLFPSFAEGFGLPPLESMACGLPVVVSRTAALAEVVGEAGLYVDADDPRGMAAAVLSLRDTTQAHVLRERGRARACLFTWSETARRTAEVYEAVAPAAGGKRRCDSARLLPGFAGFAGFDGSVKTPAAPLASGRAALARARL
jgi:alpha-1,3-rhamnosyl/mannosyltransferase